MAKANDDEGYRGKVGSEERRGRERTFVLDEKIRVKPKNLSPLRSLAFAFM